MMQLKHPELKMRYAHCIPLEVHGIPTIMDELSLLAKVKVTVADSALSFERGAVVA